jgi:nitrogen fixation-related uncharacterized protein
MNMTINDVVAIIVMIVILVAVLWDMNKNKDNND